MDENQYLLRIVQVLRIGATSLEPPSIFMQANLAILNPDNTNFAPQVGGCVAVLSTVKAVVSEGFAVRGSKAS